MKSPYGQPMANIFCFAGLKQRTFWMMRADGTAPRQVAGPLYIDPEQGDYYGYLYWPEILDVYAGNYPNV